MARLTAEVMNGQRVVYVETEEEFWHYINLGPVCAPGEICESLGFTDVLSPEEWEEELKGEREWEELQAQWAEEDWLPEPEPDPSSPFSRRDASPAPAKVIPFPDRTR